MDYLDLKFALARKGYTLTRVAEELGLFGPQSIQQVLTRKYISARVERRVSEIIGIPLEKLFPDRYQTSKRRARTNAANMHEKTRDTGRAS
ncbi:MAG: helix-turn-helix domain-containing protein [Sulfuricaulis sp.]|uniref:helix-turn-helix domain-containing protein n=1 Tax=Sulfuricaulis sp. TaxID=2003553 RepID=UPI0025DF1603|nr:helix-turn-helix domain-containing protein [Sulfuricaulis sp.]MCR4346329.1 helix-turn-helix domain-containing protein [Sulfuricaulis sp.]